MTIAHLADACLLDLPESCHSRGSEKKPDGIIMIHYRQRMVSKHSAPSLTEKKRADTLNKVKAGYCEQQATSIRQKPSF
jgi:hypothetical protein